MTRAEHCYRVLLRAYPARFRQEYEREFVLVFRDQQREGISRGVRYWTALAMDVACGAAREWHEEVITSRQPGEKMKGFATAAVLVATFELINVTVEVRAGGFVGRDALTQTGILLAVFAMTALFVSGIRLWRSGSLAVRFTGIAAAASLASFAFVGLVRPTFSIMAMLCGIGFPVALLLRILAVRHGEPSIAERNSAA